MLQVEPPPRLEIVVFIKLVFIKLLTGIMKLDQVGLKQIYLVIGLTTKFTALVLAF